MTDKTYCKSNEETFCLIYRNESGQLLKLNCGHLFHEDCLIKFFIDQNLQKFIFKKKIVFENI